MTDTMRRLGRLYAFRVERARNRAGAVALAFRCGFDARDAAKHCATAGLEALALRSVLRSMAAVQRHVTANLRRGRL